MLVEFYRFALLLTGEAETAQRVMTETLAEAESSLCDSRRETNRQAWLATSIRKRSLKYERSAKGEAHAAVTGAEGSEEAGSEIEPFLLARHFRALPEPERSALALFYLDLFSPDEIARLLNIELDGLAELLGRARDLLQHSLREAPADA